MIDRSSRNQLAELIRALCAGLISNDQFEDRLPRSSEDPAIYEVFFNGCQSPKPSNAIGAIA